MHFNPWYELKAIAGLAGLVAIAFIVVGIIVLKESWVLSRSLIRRLRARLSGM